MVRCTEVVRLISSDEYLTAGLLKRLEIRLHLAMCRNCSKYARQLRALAAAVRKNSTPILDSELMRAKADVLRRISEGQGPPRGI